MVRKHKNRSLLAVLFSGIFIFGALLLVNGCGLEYANIALGFPEENPGGELGGAWGPTQITQVVEGDHPDGGGVLGDGNPPDEGVNGNSAPPDSGGGLGNQGTAGPGEWPSMPRRYSFANAQIYSPPLLEPGG